MQILCPECRRQVPSAYFSLAELTAHCVPCKHDFGFNLKQQARLPRHIRVSASAVGWIYQKPESRVKGLFFLVFSLFWYGCFFLMVLHQLNEPENLIESGMVWVLPVIFFIGLPAVYGCLFCLLNSTWLYLTPERVEVESSPIPAWDVYQRWPRSQMQQLYCESYEGINQEGRRVLLYRLQGVDLRGRMGTLMKGIESLEEARYFEQQIEKFWGIQDRVMVGEV